MGRLAFAFGDLDAIGDPALEILHGFGADRKLDQMERHVFISLTELTFATCPAAGSSSECPKTGELAGDQSEEADGAGAAGGAGVAARTGCGAGGFLAAATVGDPGAVSDVGAPGRGDGVVGVAAEGAG